LTDDLPWVAGPPLPHPPCPPPAVAAYALLDALMDSACKDPTVAGDTCVCMRSCMSPCSSVQAGQHMLGMPSTARLDHGIHQSSAAWVCPGSYWHAVRAMRRLLASLHSVLSTADGHIFEAVVGGRQVDGKAWRRSGRAGQGDIAWVGRHETADLACLSACSSITTSMCHAQPQTTRYKLTTDQPVAPCLQGRAFRAPDGARVSA